MVHWMGSSILVTLIVSEEIIIIFLSREIFWATLKISPIWQPTLTIGKNDSQGRNKFVISIMAIGHCKR